jgi:hypothetical protein
VLRGICHPEFALSSEQSTEAFCQNFLLGEKATDSILVNTCILVFLDIPNPFVSRRLESHREFTCTGMRIAHRKIERTHGNAR